VILSVIVTAGWTTLIYVVTEDAVAMVCRWSLRRRFGEGT
jgi:hypothetical protein